jgi:hypothetical protein
MDTRRAVSAQSSKHTGIGFKTHVLVPKDESGGALTARSCYWQHCGVCNEKRLQLNTCSWFGREEDSPYSYAVCCKCAKSSAGKHTDVMKRRTCVERDSADTTGLESTVVSMKPGELRANSKNILTGEKRRYCSKILDPGMLLINPGLAKMGCRRSGIKCLAIGQVNQALEFQLVEIAHQVQWNSMRSKVHPGGGATHQLQYISGITAPLHTPIAKAPTTTSTTRTPATGSTSDRLPRDFGEGRVAGISASTAHCTCASICVALIDGGLSLVLF